MKKTLILVGFLALTPFAKGQLLLEALEGGVPFTPSEKCLERVKDKHYGDGVHNYIYCAVQGPNGKKWLNLNLGAEYAKESSPHFNPEAQPIDNKDWKAFGNLYQWGRDSDGHEQVEYRQGSERWEFRPINGVRFTRLAIGERSNQMVAVSNNNTYTDDLGTSWVNDPCPNGYHIATTDDYTGIARIDKIIGGAVEVSVFGTTQFPNLNIVTSPNTNEYSALKDGWNSSAANLNLNGRADTGTSSLWVKTNQSDWTYLTGWFRERSVGPLWYMGVLDRGYDWEYGSPIYEYGISTDMRRTGEIQYQVNQPISRAIRCVQN